MSSQRHKMDQLLATTCYWLTNAVYTIMLLMINLTGGNQQSARYPPSMTIEIVLWPLSRETLTQYINGFMAQQEVAV